jgi:uncharacterized protein
MNAEAQTLRDRLGMEPIPVEGGWFRVTWRSEEVLTDGRPLGGAILALFTDTPEGFSALHRLSVTELWHFHRGAPFDLLLLGPDGRSETVVLGPAVEDGQMLQLVVPPAVWMGGRVAAGGTYSLVGTTTTPAFTGDAFEAGSRDALIAAYPDRAAEIRRLTRPESRAGRR